MHHAAFLRVYLGPRWRSALLLTGLLFGSIGLQLVNPQLIRAFVDTALAGGAIDALLTIAALFIGVAVIGQALAVGITYLSENVAWTATNALRADLAAHCLSLDLTFHKARTPGELIERIDGDVSALASFLSQFVIHILGNLLLLVGVLVLLAREDWRLGLAFAVFALVALLALLPLRTWAVAAWTANRQASARFFGFLGEHLAGTEDVRANGAGDYVLDRLTDLLRAQLPIVRRAELAHASLWLASNAVFIVGLLLAAVLSLLLWQAGAVTIGTILLIFTYTDLLRRPIEQLRAQLQELQKATASINRVNELFHRQPAIQDGPGQPLPPGALAVDFDAVTFAYEDGEGETVLHDLTFGLAPGRVLGLLGRTGSGKTTLARLLLRFYDPSQGAIRLGGVPVTALRLAELRRQVGLVTQDVQLFEATVRDNLTFFDPSVSDVRILAALDELGLTDWLRSLPAGLDTELTSGGGLSAGEAQLLAFARVFLRDPGLIVLDEASARLDPATERLIERAVDRLLRDRTGIIIAHRLATVQRADEILVLDDGRLLEHGERRRLADDPASRFHHLLRAGLQEVLA